MTHPVHLTLFVFLVLFPATVFSAHYEKEVPEESRTVTPLRVKPVAMPLDGADLTGVKEQIDAINSIVNAINSGDIMQLTSAIAATHEDADANGTSGGSESVEYVIKTGHVAHLRYTRGKKAGTSINFRNDGSISMYMHSYADTGSVITMHFSASGTPTRLRALKELKVVGWQYKWSEDGKLIEKENVTTPRPLLGPSKE